MKINITVVDQSDEVSVELGVHRCLVPFVPSMQCTINGKEVGADCRPEDLEDATLRWRSPGLLGRAPKAHDVDMKKDVITI